MVGVFGFRIMAWRGLELYCLGAFHGFFLIADRLFLLDFYNRIGKYPSVIITYIITLFGWVLFRSNNIESAKKYFYEMIQINTSTELHISNNYFTTIFLLAVVFSFAALSAKIERIQLAFYDGELISNHFYKTSIVMFLLLLLTLQFVISANFNPFIYFRF